MIQGIGSNSGYSGGLFDIEYAQFFKLSKRFVLGFNAQEQSLTGSQSPFYLLPALGSDEMMRATTTAATATVTLPPHKTELRYRLSDRFGIVGFLGTGEVFNSTFSLKQLKPSYGGGLRYFFDVEKGLSIRADYGIGEKVTGEARQKRILYRAGGSVLIDVQFQMCECADVLYADAYVWRVPDCIHDCILS